MMKLLTYVSLIGLLAYKFAPLQTMTLIPAPIVQGLATSTVALTAIWGTFLTLVHALPGSLTAAGI